MPSQYIILDKKRQTLPSNFTEQSTVGDILKWASSLISEGRVLTRIELDDQFLDDAAQNHVRRDPIGKAKLSLTTADQKELSLTTLGKLAALIKWLAPQHKDVAALLERGNTQPGLDRLKEITIAWQEILKAYGKLAKMTDIILSELPVHELNGEAILNEFCRQLSEIQTALQNKDFVLLADILQYEMDGAIANWMALLEATLGIVEPVAT